MYIDQWNRIKDSEVDLALYRNLVYNKGNVSGDWERLTFKKNGIGIIDSHLEKLKIDSFLIPYSRINSK